MAVISSLITLIRTAVYGKDVRSAIADGIEAINTEVEDTTERQEDLEATFNNLIINAGNSNAEIVAGRYDNVNNVNHNTIGDRMDAVSSSLAEKTSVTDLTFNGVIKGIEITPGSGLNLNISEGIAYLNEKRILFSGTAKTLTPSKDTYVDLGNDGAIAYVEVANGAAEPGITANSVRIGLVSTDASTITVYYRYTRNVGLGDGAYENNIRGYDNVAVGFYALRGNTTGYRSVAIGVSALTANTTGHHNVALGQNALLSNTTGIYNTALGIDGLHDNTTGTYNIAIGQYACQKNLSGNGNTGIGISALLNSQTGDGNIAIGQYALTTQDGLSNNIAIGLECFRYNTAGNYLLGIGYQAGKANTTGNRNHFMGYQAGLSNTTGSDNTALGHHTLRLNVTNNNNTGIGSYALPSCVSDANSAVGYQSLYKVTTGNNNTGIGLQSGYQITTGSQNTFIGSGAGGTTYQTATVSNSTAIGYNAVTSESNVVQLGDTNVTKVYSHGSFECKDIGDGFICKSPDGTRYKITVANGGTIQVAAA